MPISVTNSIEASASRADCDSLDNPLLTPEQINASAANAVGILFAPGDSTQIQVEGKDDGKDGQGLGGAGALNWRSGAHWLCLISIGAAFLL